MTSAVSHLTSALFKRKKQSSITTKMYFSITLFLVAVRFALADGQSDTKILTGIVGESLCLITGQQGFDHVTLSSASDHHVLLNFYNGALERNESERYQLDTKNGAVIISPLNLNDSGEYGLQIIYRNNSRIKYTYKINVTEPDPTQAPTGHPDNPPADQKRLCEVVLPVLAVVVVVGGIMLIAWAFIFRGGNGCSSVCRRNSENNSVV